MAGRKKAADACAARSRWWRLRRRHGARRDPGSADGSGPIGVVRADTSATSILSTVDNVDSAAGRVATLLALREQLDGGTGRYGIAGNAQAPAPGVGSSAGN